MTRVLVAMSGGVDSSVAALLLQRAGHEVVGVFMRNGVAGKAAAEKTCCSASDARDAAMVADRLGMAFYSVDYEQEFGVLMDRFAAEYRAGRTPNPCVWCNSELKFGHLFSLAADVGAAAVATGHYAEAHDGALFAAADRDKDQGLFLFGVDRSALTRVLFPLGALKKNVVRAIAAEAGFASAEKPESMEICFVTSGDYRDVVRARGGHGVPGRFVDLAGKTLGEHDGVDGFTVGQRRGLPALGVPHYVVAIDAVHGQVTLAPREGLLASTAVVRAVNWLVPVPDAPRQLGVKVRARSEVAMAVVTPLADCTARIEFVSPVAAVTPGQAAVFYDGDRVLGGGWID